jgi:hypothetical protein
MKNNYQINLERAFVKYHESHREWLLCIHCNLSEAEENKVYKNLCFYREEYRKIVNE